MTEQELREKSIMILGLKSCTPELCKEYKSHCGDCCFYRILALIKGAGYVKLADINLPANPYGARKNQEVYERAIKDFKKAAKQAGGK